MILRDSGPQIDIEQADASRFHWAGGSGACTLPDRRVGEELQRAFLYLDIVQGILVAFQAQVLEGVAYAFAGYRLAVLPVLAIDYFLHARLGDGVKILTHLHHDVFAAAAVLTVEVDDRMGGSAGTGEVVESNRIFARNELIANKQS